MPFEVAGRCLDRVEAEAFVGVEVEYQPVGLFDVGDRRSPAMELDRPHLDAGQQAVGIVDIEIRLLVAVLLLDHHVLDVVAERSSVMLLEEAMLAAPLRAATQADRAVGDPLQRDGGALGAGLAFSSTTPAASLSPRSPRKLGWRSTPSGVNSVKAISATSLGVTQWAPRPAARGASTLAVLRSSRSILARRSFIVATLKPVPTLPA